MGERLAVTVNNNEKGLVSLQEGKSINELICLCGSPLPIKVKNMKVKQFLKCNSCGRIYFKGSEKEQEDIVDKLLKEIQTEIKVLNVIYDFKSEGYIQYCSKDIDIAIDEQIKEIESLYAELQEIQKAGYRVDYIEGILSNRQTLRK
jgi:hypothetical protein